MSGSVEAGGDREGWRVARAAIDRLADRFGPRLVSGYVIGSLAHGGFEPAVSDVDVAVLLDACTSEVPDVVAEAVLATRERLGSDLAERLSVFYGDWPNFASPAPPARLEAIDRLDLMQDGVLIAGVDCRDDAGQVPSRRELVEATAGFLTRNPLRMGDPVRLVAAGPRELTKTVLFPVRFLYTLATGRAGGNDEAAGWYCREVRPATPLVRAALTWRRGTVPAQEAVSLVQTHLRGLQDECTRAFAA